MASLSRLEDLFRNVTSDALNNCSVFVNSGVATGGARGQSATPDKEKKCQK